MRELFALSVLLSDKERPLALLLLPNLPIQLLDLGS